MTFPKVSIVMSTYKESTKPYLDLTIESIDNMYYPGELEKILVARDGYMPTYPGWKTIAPPQKEFANCVGVNFGVKNADPNAKFVFLVNDDIVFTKNCLHNLVLMLGDARAVLLPLSSCHLGYQYSLALGYREGNDLVQIQKRFNRLSDFLPIKDKLMNSDSVYPPGIWFEHRHLCLFAGLYPRNVWDELGGFDETFETSQDDTDFSLRALSKGVALGHCLNAMAFHFGGVTSSETMTDELRKKSYDRFQEKYGSAPT